MPESALLLILLIANSAPVLARHLLGSRWAQPLDGGRYLRDGNRLFGASKTWRGMVAAVVASVLAALLLGLSWPVGLVLGAGAMAGDLLSSFCKRRLGKPSSSRATGLDQLPESLLPLLLCQPLLDYSFWVIPLLALLFMLIDMGVSPLLFRLGFRNRPF
jgi:CDP-2,3-bis-(O-geranylgeranyl)-sn-glycerol synthase